MNNLIQNMLIGAATSVGSGLLLWCASLLRSLGKSVMASIQRIIDHGDSIAALEKDMSDLKESVDGLRNEMVHLSSHVADLGNGNNGSRTI